MRHLDTSAEITWLAVHADHRGSGLGTRLVDHLAAEMTAEGRRLLVVLTVSASDGPDEVEDGYDATRAFYRSAGFVEARDFAGLLGPGRHAGAHGACPGPLTDRRRRSSMCCRCPAAPNCTVRDRATIAITLGRVATDDGAGGAFEGLLELLRVR